MLAEAKLISGSALLSTEREREGHLSIFRPIQIFYEVNGKLDFFQTKSPNVAISGKIGRQLGRFLRHAYIFHSKYEGKISLIHIAIA